MSSSHECWVLGRFSMVDQQFQAENLIKQLHPLPAPNNPQLQSVTNLLMFLTLSAVTDTIILPARRGCCHSAVLLAWRRAAFAGGQSQNGGQWEWEVAPWLPDVTVLPLLVQEMEGKLIIIQTRKDFFLHLIRGQGSHQNRMQKNTLSNTHVILWTVPRPRCPTDGSRWWLVTGLNWDSLPLAVHNLWPTMPGHQKNLLPKLKINQLRRQLSY